MKYKQKYIAKIEYTMVSMCIHKYTQSDKHWSDDMKFRQKKNHNRIRDKYNSTYLI